MLVACNVCQNITCKTWVKRYTHTYEELQPQVENEILKQFTLQLICDIKCLVSELSLILITIKPLIYNVPGLKCHLISPPTLVLVDHFSYLTRNILTYTVQIHAIVNPHTQKSYP